MFILVEVEDKIKLNIKSEDNKQEIWSKIEHKFIGKIIPDVGIGIIPTEIIKIYEYKIVEDYLIANVKFIMLVFRFFRGELLFGNILDQNSNEIKIEMPFFDQVTIPQDNLPDVCENTYISTSEGKHFAWVWIYKDNRLFFKNRETIRWKVDYINDSTVIGQVYDTGLGPTSWWM